MTASPIRTLVLLCSFGGGAVIVLGLLARPAEAQPRARPPDAPVSSSAPSSAREQAAGTDAAPPLDALVTEALARAPALAAGMARRDAARERERPAGALPDPMATAGWTEADFPLWSIGREPMSAFSIGVQQALPYPGKRRARRLAAESETAIRDAEIASQRASIAVEVRRSYASLYAMDGERRAFDAAGELLDLLATTAASRYAVGQSEQEPVVKAQLERSRLDERIDDLAADRRAVVAALNRLLDRPGENPLGEVRELPLAPEPPQDAEGLVRERSPMLAVRRAAIAAAERNVAVAALDARPDFVAGSDVGIRGGLPPVVSISVGVEWPWRKNERQRPLLRAAEQDVVAARADLDAEWAAVRSDVARVRSEWRRADAQVRRYEQAILPQTSAAIDAARAAYLAGRGDFSTVVENFRLWLDARVALGRRQAERFAAWAAMQSMIAPDAGPGVVQEQGR